MSAEKTGYFLFSLDTELAWGHFDCFRADMFSADGSRERKAVREILALCEEFDIAATWACTGQLLSDRYPEVDTYPEAWRGRYPVFEALYRRGHPLLHGGDVIQMLLAQPGRHEIAFHGFTHGVFDERQMNAADAAGEIRNWLLAARNRTAAPTTIVFPRNKIGHLPVLKEAGFNCYRGIEPRTRAHNLPVLGKGFRRYQELTSFLTPPIYDLPAPDDSGMVNLPGSRWLFGFNHRADRVLHVAGQGLLRMQPIVAGVRQAAAQGKIIHLWAHPYELRTDADFQKLRYVLSSVAEELQRGTMRSVSMGSLAQISLQRAATGAYGTGF